jgi:cell division protein ZapA (FtsZ GTPase activity inhibitor)
MMGGGKGGVKRTVQIVLAGRRYRVVTTGTDEELAHLGGVVEKRAQEVSGGKGVTPDSILLAAMTFAHEAEAERARAERVMDLASRGARDLLVRVEHVLGESEEGEEGGSGDDSAT